MNKEKIWTDINYVVMATLIFGQITIGWFFLVGQGAYLIGNVINVTRDFKLNRPIADKVKDIAFLAITVGLLILKVLGK